MCWYVHKMYDLAAGRFSFLIYAIRKEILTAGRTQVSIEVVC